MPTVDDIVERYVADRADNLQIRVESDNISHTYRVVVSDRDNRHYSIAINEVDTHVLDAAVNGFYREHGLTNGPGASATTGPTLASVPPLSLQEIESVRRSFDRASSEVNSMARFIQAQSGYNRPRVNATATEVAHRIKAVGGDPDTWIEEQVEDLIFDVTELIYTLTNR